MNQRIAWLWGLGTVAIAAIVAAIAYHLGQATTVVTTAAPGPGGQVYPYYYHDGFGFFWIFPLFLILFLVFAFRRPWGRGYGGYGGHWHHDRHDHHDQAGTQSNPGQGPSDTRPGA